MAVKKRVELEFRTRGAEKAAKQTKKIDQNLKSMGMAALKAGAAFFGARALLSGFMQSIELAGQQELAERKLATALGGTSKELLQYASALQKSTAFGDEATIEAMSMMAAFTQDEEALKKLTEVTMDYASATGTDLNSAAQLVGRTFGTSMNAMSRYGVEVEGAAGSTKRLESLTGNLAKMFGGQAAAAADTMSGQIEQMKNAIGDTGEVIGNLFAPMVISLAKSFKAVAEGISEALDGISKAEKMMEAEAKKRMELSIKGLEREIFLREQNVTRLKREVGSHGENAFQIRLERDEIEILKNRIGELRGEEIGQFFSDSAIEAQLATEVISKYRGELKDLTQEIKKVAVVQGESSEIWLSEGQQVAVDMTRSLATNLAAAVIHGQDLGEALTSSLKAIAIEMAANAAIFLLLQSITGGTGGAFATTQAGKGGFLGFLLKGFTGQTPRVNNHVHISGGLISDSYVRNTLVPAMNRVRSFG